jgi:hypothetical protein
MQIACNSHVHVHGISNALPFSALHSLPQAFRV